MHLQNIWLNVHATQTMKIHLVWTFVLSSHFRLLKLGPGVCGFTLTHAFSHNQFCGRENITYSRTRKVILYHYLGQWRQWRWKQVQVQRQFCSWGGYTMFCLIPMTIWIKLQGLMMKKLRGVAHFMNLGLLTNMFPKKRLSSHHAIDTTRQRKYQKENTFSTNVWTTSTITNFPFTMNSSTFQRIKMAPIARITFTGHICILGLMLKWSALKWIELFLNLSAGVMKMNFWDWSKCLWHCYQWKVFSLACCKKWRNR